MSDELSRDEVESEMIRQLRDSELDLEHIARDLRESDFPGLLLAVEGARAYAEDLLILLGFTEGPPELSG